MSQANKPSANTTLRDFADLKRALKQAAFATLRQRYGLLPLAEARRGIHQPRDRDQLQASRQRLVFDEFLLLQLGLGQRRLRLRNQPAPALTLTDGEPPLTRRMRPISAPSTMPRGVSRPVHAFPAVSKKPTMTATAKPNSISWACHSTGERVRLIETCPVRSAVHSGMASAP